MFKQFKRKSPRHYDVAPLQTKAMIPQQPTPLIKLDLVNVSIHHKHILNNVCLEIFDHEVVSLIGPNGAGKSTLLKTILGIQKNYLGRIIKRADLRLAYVPQQPHWNHSLPLTVTSLLQLSSTLAWSSSSAQNIIKDSGISPLLNKSIHVLSGGERQRVMLAQALLTEPNLLILDEPMQGLDASSEKSLYQLLARIPQRYNTAILMVSHDLNWVMQGTTRVICLNHHICCSGTPHHVQNSNAYQQLFGGEALHYSHHHHCSHGLHHLSPQKVSPFVSNLGSAIFSAISKTTKIAKTTNPQVQAD